MWIKSFLASITQPSVLASRAHEQLAPEDQRLWELTPGLTLEDFLEARAAGRRRARAELEESSSEDEWSPEELQHLARYGPEGLR